MAEVKEFAVNLVLQVGTPEYEGGEFYTGRFQAMPGQLKFPEVRLPLCPACATLLRNLLRAMRGVVNPYQTTIQAEGRPSVEPTGQKVLAGIPCALCGEKGRRW